MKYGKRFHGIKSQKYGLICGNVCINLPDIKRECNTNNQSFCGVWGESYLERSAINSGSNPHSLTTISAELFRPSKSKYVFKTQSSQKAGFSSSIENQFRDALSSTHNSQLTTHPPPTYPQTSVNNIQEYKEYFNTLLLYQQSIHREP